MLAWEIMSVKSIVFSSRPFTSSCVRPKIPCKDTSGTPWVSTADFGWHCSHPVVLAGYHMLGLCHSVPASSTVRSRTVITDHLRDFKLLQRNTPRMEQKLTPLTLCCGENFSDWLCYALKGCCHQKEQNYFLWGFTLY